MPAANSGTERAGWTQNSPAQDATEAALIGLVRQSMSENTEATKSGFARMGDGMEAMAKEMRMLFRMIGLAFFLMVAGLIAIAGGAAYFKVAGIEIHTGASAATDVVGP